MVVRGREASTEAGSGLFEVASCRSDVGCCLCRWLGGVGGTGGRDGKDEEEEDSGVEEDKEEEEEETPCGGWWPHVAATRWLLAAWACVGAGGGGKGEGGSDH